MVTNAIKYTPQGGTVALSLEEDDEAVTFSVRDSGIGIAPGDLPHIFERFWRADPARSRTGERPGVGLGLSPSPSGSWRRTGDRSPCRAGRAGDRSSPSGCRRRRLPRDSFSHLRYHRLVIAAPRWLQLEVLTSRASREPLHVRYPARITTVGAPWTRPVTVALVFHILVIVVAVGRTASPPGGYPTGCSRYHPTRNDEVNSSRAQG